MPRFGFQRLWTLGLCGLLLVAHSASAQACGTIVRVTFVEASPDRFMIEHMKGEAGQLVSVTIDMSTSVGGAFVDTAYGPDNTSAGQGVEVDTLKGFREGSQSGTITFRKFSSGHQLNLLVDLDDRATGGDNDMDVLTANELEGGIVRARIRGADGVARAWTGTFDAGGIALVGNRACA